MCGIVGYVSNKEMPYITEMVGSIKHRGPDDYGIHVDSIDDRTHVHLAHARLSIQDLSSRGHQPFVSACAKYIIVYNGEVYNFKAIQEELRSLGYEFKSNSDTEVILYAYQAWGIHCLDKFIGMFAFAIYDLEKEKLFLVRDRAGVKPLYYAVSEDTFFFSSEIKALYPHPHFKKEINRDILPYYFQFGYIPAPYTIYHDCYKLQPGQYMLYDLTSKTYDIHTYWDIHTFYTEDKIQKSEEEIVDDLEKLLLDACQLRMVSDVPVGVFLSGGYDSSTVTALLQKHGKEQINTFTIGFEEKEFNEADDAQRIATYLGTKHTEYYCTPHDMLALIDDLCYYWDEPFADDSALPTMIVSNLAREAVTVALSADGGDEVFFGYSKYFAIEKIIKLKKSPIKTALLKLLVNGLTEKRVMFLNALIPKSKRQSNIVDKFKKFKNMMNSDTLAEMFIRASSQVEANYLDEVLVNGAFKDFENVSLGEFKKIGNLETLNQMMLIDYKTFMVDDVLCKVDRATMSVSLEGREPLLDHRIAEYMARIPTSLKYKNGAGKYLLRQVLARHIPKEMTDRPKSGFTVPLKDWILNELKEKAIDALESQILLDDAIIKEAHLTRIKKNLERGKVENPTFIWMIIMYVMWRKRWN